MSAIDTIINEVKALLDTVNVLTYEKFITLKTPHPDFESTLEALLEEWNEAQPSGWAFDSDKLGDEEYMLILTNENVDNDNDDYLEALSKVEKPRKVWDTPLDIKVEFIITTPIEDVCEKEGEMVKYREQGE